MLHAPASEAKTETAQCKSQLAPLSKREHHPLLPSMEGQHMLSGGAGNAISNHTPGAQRRQTLAGLQSTYGNQAVLRTLHTSPQVARMTPLRPSQGVMVQHKCACGGSSEAEGECVECKAKREGALQRHVANQGASPAVNTAPPLVHDVLRSPGQPLDAGTLAFMEPRFGHDVSRIPIPPPAAGALQTKLAINKPGDEYKQVADVREEMRSDPISSPVAPALQFDFARIPATTMPIQRKPTVSSPGDPFEREADDVAEKVLRMVEPTPISSAPAAIQRKCAECEEEKEKSIQTKLAPSVVAQRTTQGATTRPVALQGVEVRDEEDTPFRQTVIFRKAEFAMPPIDESASPITARLAAWQVGGELLPAVTRQSMENAFGYDFSRVRVHRDAEAGEISQQLSALAFTHGGHIYFGNGMYDPAGSSGKRLLAHELTHVVQQGHAAPLGNGIAATFSSAIQASAPTIQRFSYFEGGVVHQVNNLADTVLYGKDVGTTFALLNGSPIKKTAQTQNTYAQVRAALKKPTLSFSPVATGGFDARVRAVPMNKGSFDETVLAPSSWKLNAPKATVLAKYPDLTTCRGAGRTIFQALGMPSDAAMFAASRRHEDHHVDGFISAFMGTIWLWDTELDVAAGSSTPYHGRTKADAEAALYAAMGGTPDQIADKYSDTVVAAIEAYHNTPEGDGVSCDSETAQADERCTTSSVKCTNPA